MSDKFAVGGLEVVRPAGDFRADDEDEGSVDGDKVVFDEIVNAGDGEKVVRMRVGVEDSGVILEVRGAW